MRRRTRARAEAAIRGESAGVAWDLSRICWPDREGRRCAEKGLARPADGFTPAAVPTGHCMMATGIRVMSHEESCPTTSHVPRRVTSPSMRRLPAPGVISPGGPWHGIAQHPGHARDLAQKYLTAFRSDLRPPAQRIRLARRFGRLPLTDQRAFATGEALYPANRCTQSVPSVRLPFTPPSLAEKPSRTQGQPA